MTNKQYKTWKRMIKYYLLAGFMLGIMIGCYFWPPFASFAMADPSPSVILSHTEGVKPTFKEFSDYVRVVFGKSARTALAVSQAECNPNRPEWPNCINAWKRGNRGEYSLGAFQINLLAHKDKIPGKTNTEKVEWLEDWKNNVVMAHVIYSHSGFRPWTAWTSGAYRKFI